MYYEYSQGKTLVSGCSHAVSFARTLCRAQLNWSSSVTTLLHCQECTMPRDNLHWHWVGRKKKYLGFNASLLIHIYIYMHIYIYRHTNLNSQLSLRWNPLFPKVFEALQVILVHLWRTRLAASAINCYKCFLCEDWNTLFCFLTGHIHWAPHQT